jgi:hypothetical protein
MYTISERYVCTPMSSYSFTHWNPVKAGDLMAIVQSLSGRICRIVWICIFAMSLDLRYAQLYNVQYKRDIPLFSL